MFLRRSNVHTRQMLPVPSYLEGIPKLAKLIEYVYIPKNLIVLVIRIFATRKEFMNYLHIYIYVKDFCIQLIIICKKLIFPVSFRDMKYIVSKLFHNNIFTLFT